LHITACPQRNDGYVHYNGSLPIIALPRIFVTHVKLEFSHFLIIAN
jgi:hypothetical protein